jgi:hypothetical protein
MNPEAMSFYATNNDVRENYLVQNFLGENADKFEKL